MTVSGNVTNFAITCNVIHDADNAAIAAIGLEEVAADPTLDYARNGTISRNILYNISTKNNPAEDKEYDADGISADSASDVTIDRNLIYNVDIGIEVASQHRNRAAHNVTVRNNLIYHANSTGISIGGDSPSAGGPTTARSSTIRFSGTIPRTQGAVNFKFSTILPVLCSKIILSRLRRKAYLLIVPLRASPIHRMWTTTYISPRHPHRRLHSFGRGRTTVALPLTKQRQAGIVTPNMRTLSSSTWRRLTSTSSRLRRQSIQLLI